jgi:adenosylcobinamide-GDP ribazoletransferase
MAIARYPYLKPTGKGAFHKTAIRSQWETLPTLILLLSVSAISVYFPPHLWSRALTLAIGGSSIACLIAAWFNHKLGGHTGDTYGAVVEWTETLLLCVLTIVW